MPELPEVENIRLQLEKYLIGHNIEEVEVRFRKSLPSGEKNLLGGKVKKIRRFGKAQVIDLDNGYSLIIHIKMTGQLIYRGPNIIKTPKLSEKVLGGLEGKHTHVIFHLDRKGKLYFNDVRKFGWIKVVKTNQVEGDSFIKKLGPEPFRDLTIEKFKKTLEKTSRAIKVLLMDQSKISGVGNIYANDALWLSKINPNKPSNKLKKDEAEKLFNAIEKVLNEGLKRGGASEQRYVTPDGKEGEYQKYFLVYGHEGDTCQRCKKAKIDKLSVGGRGTYYCPNCQK